MGRDSTIGTKWQEAWGTAGTQYMKPGTHIEGLGSLAEKIDDRMAFLAFQNTDVLFSEDTNFAFAPDGEEFKLAVQWLVYYNGYHPHLWFRFFYGNGGAPVGKAGTTSLRLGDIDFGTLSVTRNGGTFIEWCVDVPETLHAGEYPLKVYISTDYSIPSNLEWNAFSAAWLPTEL
jgi:hypothetical protein